MEAEVPGPRRWRARLPGGGWVPAGLQHALEDHVGLLVALHLVRGASFAGRGTLSRLWRLAMLSEERPELPEARLPRTTLFLWLAGLAVATKGCGCWRSSCP